MFPLFLFYQKHNGREVVVNKMKLVDKIKLVEKYVGCLDKLTVLYYLIMEPKTSLAPPDQHVKPK